ncbi:protein phosphatase 2C, partial [Cooperia oncophora]
FYRQGYVIGRNLSKGKPSAEKICCNNEEQECGEDKCPKGKRQSRSPTQEPAKRAKTEGNGSVLSMLINTDGEGDTVSTEVNASESADSVAAMKEAPTDPSVISSTNNSANNDDRPADEHKELEGNGQTPPIIKTKQKKVPVNADKKADTDGIRRVSNPITTVSEIYTKGSKNKWDDDESEDDSDFNEAEEEAEDEECDDEEENESDDDTDEVAIPGGLETPGEDSGTTACVCLMNKERIVVANAGDSRAVLCRGGTAIDLSMDHKPEDDVEKTRIVNAGGFVNEDGRVNGGLNLSRAFGDHSYKKNADLPLRDQMITALPDVKVETLQPSDEFLVVACDGIWNSLNSQQVVDFIRERLKRGKSCVDISSELWIIRFGADDGR